jgi:hypothetical protein
MMNSENKPKRLQASLPLPHVKHRLIIVFHLVFQEALHENEKDKQCMQHLNTDLNQQQQTQYELSFPPLVNRQGKHV